MESFELVGRAAEDARGLVESRLVEMEHFTNGNINPAKKRKLIEGLESQLAVASLELAMEVDNPKYDVDGIMSEINKVKSGMDFSLSEEIEELIESEEALPLHQEDLENFDNLAREFGLELSQLGVEGYNQIDENNRWLVDKYEDLADANVIEPDVIRLWEIHEEIQELEGDKAAKIYMMGYEPTADGWAKPQVDEMEV
ncbi:MAG: hypothetical protein FWE31_01575 [Firmicutes bacterium]|nr:hypothetical protein [Bacillota bacterium]